MATTSESTGKQPPEQMKHVDFEKDKVTPEQRRHMDQMTKKVQEHVKYMKRVRNKNRLVAVGLGLGVIGIFSYSIYAVGRESFLDDFDDPNKPKDL